jgi:hypothetical protein
METLRQEVLKDYKSSAAYCYKHPEAKLPGDGDHRYGFKLETPARQYFVRCTTLRDDYFYVFAYDKTAPVKEQERSAGEKISVLNKIKDSQKAPLPSSKKKANDKKKEGMEL